MTTIVSYPLISSVKPLSNKRLMVTFANGISKVYDCTPLLESKAFRPLQDEILFKKVHADPPGYAVIWNDEIDLAESELWIHGEIVIPSAAPSPPPASQTPPH